tara:strand:+ start:856 stop:1395 length:540 start_codon:yes stop_codon:yes gene_type:complete
MAVVYPLKELTGTHKDLNRSLEESWGGLLTVMAERWPDWPVEVWGRILADEEDGEPRWLLQFLVSFAGEPADNREVAAMTSFLLHGLARCLGEKAAVYRTPISPECKPLWVIDDARVFRLTVPEHTIDAALYLLGHYAGQPAFFAASTSAWPLLASEAEIELADADLAWAFDGWEALQA